MEVLKRVSSGSNEADQVYPMPFFRDEVSKAIGVRGGVSDSDFQIILTYLGRDKSAIIYDSRVSLTPYPAKASSEKVRRSKSKGRETHRPRCQIRIVQSPP